jgi:hypothetical protein
MGSVINFFARGRYSRKGKGGERKEQPATVIILPVIRIERFSEPSELEPRRGHPRRRRRPARSP